MSRRQSSQTEQQERNVRTRRFQSAVFANTSFTPATRAQTNFSLSLIPPQRRTVTSLHVAPITSAAIDNVPGHGTFYIEPLVGNSDNVTQFVLGGRRNQVPNPLRMPFTLISNVRGRTRNHPIPVYTVGVRIENAQFVSAQLGALTNRPDGGLSDPRMRNLHGHGVHFSHQLINFQIFERVIRAALASLPVTDQRPNDQWRIEISFNRGESGYLFTYGFEPMYVRGTMDFSPSIRLMFERLVVELYFTAEEFQNIQRLLNLQLQFVLDRGPLNPERGGQAIVLPLSTQNERNDIIPHRGRETLLGAYQRLGVSVPAYLRERVAIPPYIPPPQLRRSTRTGGRRVGGKMDQCDKHGWKKGLFHFYFQTRALMDNPFDDNDGCLIRAFMGAECRTVIMDANKNWISIRENAPQPLAKECSNDFISIQLNEYDGNEMELCALMQDSIWGTSTHKLVLFNPYSKRSRGRKVELTDTEKEQWILCAYMMHFWLEKQIGHQIDFNEMDNLQYYADQFDVYIGIYHSYHLNDRTHLFCPKGKSVPIDSFNMICLLVQNDHVYPITQLRRFLKKGYQKDLVNIMNICPFCNKMLTHNTCVEMTKHMNKCCPKGFQCSRIDLPDLIQNEGPRRLVWKKDKKRNTFSPMCALCYADVTGPVHLHICKMKPKENYKRIEDNCLFVFDFEAAQSPCQLSTSLLHHIDLAVIQRMYPINDDEYETFVCTTIHDFVKEILDNKKYRKSVFLAHNGGGYDVQFLVVYLEANGIEYTFIPKPSSAHKYMSLNITGYDITFLDFIQFCPGSLRSIAESFRLPSSKSYFPHLFHTPERRLYRGCLPPFTDTTGQMDYWLQRNFRSPKEKTDFLAWYQQMSELYCTCLDIPYQNETILQCPYCLKEIWDLQKEMKTYCIQDVQVLSGATRIYRQFVLEIEFENGHKPMIDPYAMLTLAQVAMHILLSLRPNEISCIPEASRYGQCPEGFLWIQQMAKQLNVDIIHRGNSVHEYYDMDLKMTFDGYSPSTREVFYYVNCHLWGCPTCFPPNEYGHQIHPFRGCTYHDVWTHFQHKIEAAQGVYQNRFHIAFSHDPLPTIELTNAMTDWNPRNTFCGGRTEVFGPYIDLETYNKGRDIPCLIHDYDVVSLYPYVCAFKELPIGEPTYIPGEYFQIAKMDKQHPDYYFGYIRCTIQSSDQEKIGLLPSHDKDGKLVFLKGKQTGTWGTEELGLALRHGYIILHVEMIIHWPKSQRSDQTLRAYIEFFLRLKQESEGWIKLGASSEEPTEEEKEVIIERLYLENGCIARIRKDKVRYDPCKRKILKDYLNTLWGKFAQCPVQTRHTTLHSYDEFCKLWYNPGVNKTKIQFREISTDIFKVHYSISDGYSSANPRGNIYLAAKVTESARCVLHEYLIEVERLYGYDAILYVDTDSVKHVSPLPLEQFIGNGLGRFKNELAKGEFITAFIALAPKFYYVQSNLHNVVKTKGVSLTTTNLDRLNIDEIKKALWSMVQQDEHPYQIRTENRRIQSIKKGTEEIPYGSMVTCETVKNIQAVLTKRQIEPVLASRIEDCAQITTIPLCV